MPPVRTAPVLVNTVSTFRCGGASATRISKWFALGSYNPTRFAGVRTTLARSGACTVLFKTGRCKCNAARSPQEALLSAHQTVARLCAFGEDARVEGFRMCNHVYHAHLGAQVDLPRLCAAFAFETEAELLIKGCVRWRRPNEANPNATVQLFGTGGCVLTGVRREKDAASIWEAVERDARPFLLLGAEDGESEKEPGKKRKRRRTKRMDRSKK